jgi:hypothetical protein
MTAIPVQAYVLRPGNKALSLADWDEFVKALRKPVSVQFTRTDEVKAAPNFPYLFPASAFQDGTTAGHTLRVKGADFTATVTWDKREGAYKVTPNTFV